MVFNTDWVHTFFAVVVILSGVYACVHIPLLKKNKLATGVLFGLISLINIFITGNVDVPVIISGMFFGSPAGFVTGVISAIVRIAVPLGGRVLMARCLCALATLIVTAFVMILKHWSFEEKTPLMFPAVIGSVFAVVLHLTMYFVTQVHDPFTAFHDVYTAGPLTLAETVSALLLAHVVYGEKLGWRKNLFSMVTFSFLIFLISCCIVTAVAVHCAMKVTNDGVERALNDFTDNIENQIGFMLHNKAILIAQRIGNRTELSDEEMRALAAEFDVDEINIKASDGHTLSSNDPRVKHGSKFSPESEKAKPYFELLTGKTNFVQQNFRRGINNPDVVAKYVAIRLPDKNTFLQLGYTWNHLGRTFDTYFFPSMKNNSVKKFGHLLVVDRNGKVMLPVYRHENAYGKNIEEIGISQECLHMPPGEPFYMKVFNIWCRCSVSPQIGEWRVFAVLPLAEQFQLALYITLVVIIIMFFVGFAFRMALTHMWKVQNKLNLMRAAEEERREKELALARDIQTSDLQTDDPDTKFYRVHTIMETAKEVGGDFYDYYELDQDRLVITIADVSGKGIPAAIFMMKAKTNTRNAVMDSATLAQAITAVNHKLCYQNSSLMFVTLWIGVFNFRTGDLEYISAGHNPPLVKRAKDGRAEWIRGKHGLALGIRPGTEYTSRHLQLEKGDKVILYTDGVTEALNPQKELYGEKRLEKLAARTDGNIIPPLRTDVLHFMGKEPQADDITVLTMEYTGK